MTAADKTLEAALGNVSETWVALATEVDGCFQAAYAEGLSERLAEADQDVGTLADLVFRRLIPAHQAAIEALAAQPPAAPVETARIKELEAQIDTLTMALTAPTKEEMQLRERVAKLEKEAAIQAQCSADTAEVVARLRKIVGPISGETQPLMKEAADLIERLSAAPQAVLVRGPDCACCERQPRKDCTIPGCTTKDAGWALPAPQGAGK